MKLTPDEVKKVARLANLTLKETELTKFEDQLSETLHFVERMESLEVENVEPTSQVTGLFNTTRPDEVEPSLTQDEALQNAHLKEGGFFKVKAIFEEQ